MRKRTQNTKRDMLTAKHDAPKQLSLYKQVDDEHVHKGRYTNFEWRKRQKETQNSEQ